MAIECRMGGLAVPHPTLFYLFFLEQKNKGDGMEKDRVYTPNRTYDVQVKIKDQDYTNDMLRVIIGSSLSTAYQVVSLVMSVDPNDILVEDLFGGEPIKLNITLHREQVYPGPRVDVELMYVSSSFQLTEKDEMSTATQKDRTILTIVTVVRKCYQTMNALVNKVFIGTNLSAIITQLASDVGATVTYDTDGQNKESIDQICIPPTTFYKVVKEHTRNDPDVFDGYLDQRFGLFDGVPGVFCQYDNKVYIMNLTSNLKKDQAFTIYELSGMRDEKETERIMKESLDGKVFYTYTTIETDYSGNAKFAKLATSLKHLVRPNDTITATVEQELETVAKDYSLLYLAQSTSPNLNIDPAVNRTRYYNEDTGFNINPTLFNSRYSRTIADLSTISMSIERNLPVLNLIEVGKCVKFKPKTLEYADLEGKYILWSSEINLSRPADWQATARINLVRTNKKN